MPSKKGFLVPEPTPVYTPKGIAISPTYECPCMCDHCNIRFNEINIKERLSVEDGIRILREAKNAGLNAFQLVGGEPTLYEDFFVASYAEAGRLSMKRHRPPTNCALGGDEKRLRSFFKRLADTGFSAGFRISLDRFHHKIPVEHIAGFIAVSSEYFSLKPYSIGCCDVDEEQSKTLLRRLACILTDSYGISAVYDEEKKFMVNEEAISVGFWAPTRPTWKPLPDVMFRFSGIDVSGEPQRFQKGAPISSYPCLGSQGVGYLWVEPNGDVRPCCGNAVNFIDALIVGNIHRESVAEIIEKASNSKFIKTLASGGPVELAKILNMGHVLENKYTHRCDLCHTIFASMNNT